MKDVTVKRCTLRKRSSFKEEIKAAYGYGRVYSVPAISRINALNCSSQRQNKGQSERRDGNVKFADVLEKATKDKEAVCTIYGYGKTGVHEEYLYMKREYRH